jgi:hypothetical protein
MARKRSFQFWMLSSIFVLVNSFGCFACLSLMKNQFPNLKYQFQEWFISESTFRIYSFPDLEFQMAFGVFFGFSGGMKASQGAKKQFSHWNVGVAKWQVLGSEDWSSICKVR